MQVFLFNELPDDTRNNFNWLLLGFLIHIYPARGRRGPRFRRTRHLQLLLIFTNQSVDSTAAFAPAAAAGPSRRLITRFKLTPVSASTVSGS